MNFCVVLSNCFPPDPAREQLIEDLAAKLSGQGVHTLVIPDVYHLRHSSEAYRLLQNLPNPLIFCGFYHPRASFWTLRTMGISPQRSAATGVPEAGSERPLVCLNLAEHRNVERWLETLRQHFGGTFPGGTGKLLHAQGQAAERWYPVIDLKRCSQCSECAEFCLFGVYGKHEGRILVDNPDACKPGCPACSRVCPSQAIIFPAYASDAVIAGSDEGSIKPFDAQTLARIQQHRANMAEAQKSSALNSPGQACSCPENDKSTADPGASGALLKPVQPGRRPEDNATYFDQVIERLVRE